MADEPRNITPTPNENDDPDLNYFTTEAVDALREAKNLLYKAGETYDEAISKNDVIKKINEIKSICDTLLADQTPLPTPENYRTGVIFSFDGVNYWHSGRTYGVRIGSPSGDEFDLRNIPGFKTVETRYGDLSHFFYEPDWQKYATEHPDVRVALDLLRAKSEELWWEMVADFLRDFLRKQEDLKLAKEALIKAGIPPNNAAYDAIGTIYYSLAAFDY